jgi:hypothetical protein
VSNCSDCVCGGDKASFSAMNMDIDFSFKYDMHRDAYANRAV